MYVRVVDKLVGQTLGEAGASVEYTSTHSTLGALASRY